MVDILEECGFDWSSVEGHSETQTVFNIQAVPTVGGARVGRSADSVEVSKIG